MVWLFVKGVNLSRGENSNLIIIMLLTIELMVIRNMGISYSLKDS